VFGISRSEASLATLREECPEIQTFCQDISNWDAARDIVEKLPVIDYLANMISLHISIKLFRQRGTFSRLTMRAPENRLHS
jgi:hypothetical protein